MEMKIAVVEKKYYMCLKLIQTNQGIHWWSVPFFLFPCVSLANYFHLTDFPAHLEVVTCL